MIRLSAENSAYVLVFIRAALLFLLVHEGIGQCR
jgi:hypothetical protein